MFAIVESGGKQYQVAEGSLLKIEKLPDPIKGKKVEFESVLMLSDADGKIQIGKPTVEGAKVVGEIIAQDRHPKILVFKKKRRHNYRRKNGHRQAFTLVKVVSIKS